MIALLQSIWNSTDKLDRTFAFLSVAFLTFGILSALFAFATYEVSQRRDLLKGKSAAASEIQRKQESAALNAKVIIASEAAAVSVEKLDVAEGRLLKTQRDLASATLQAAEASVRFAEAQAKIRELDKKGKKVVTIQMRSELTYASSQPLSLTEGNTTSIENNVAIWASYGLNPIRFHADRSEQRNLSPTTMLVITDLLSDNPLLTSGLDLSSLDGRDELFTNAIQTIRQKVANNFVAKHWRWTLILNGAAFVMLDFNVPERLVQSHPTDQIIRLDIPRENQQPSAKYEKLFE